MDFGIIYEMQRPTPDGVVDEKALIEETIEQCVLADRVGFDYVWFVEHHFLTTFSGSSAPEVIIGALASLTKRIRLGFGVVVLPHEHPIRVAEKVAMADHVSGGRIDFGTGRSNSYEQQGFEIDPRDTRAIWDEALEVVCGIWREKEEFQWEGSFWNIPPRRIHPKPQQSPHPPIWVAAMQPETYTIAAEKGLGVLAFSSEAPVNYTEHIKEYRENIKNAKPVGDVVNDKWGNFTIGYCGEDNEEAQKLGADAIKSFFGPDRPYVQGRRDVYKNLLEAWGGLPDHLQREFDNFPHRERLGVRRRRGPRHLGEAGARHPRRARRHHRGRPRKLRDRYPRPRGVRGRSGAHGHADRHDPPRQGHDLHRSVWARSHPEVQVGVGTGDHGANLLTTALACSLISGFSFRSHAASNSLYERATNLTSSPSTLCAKWMISCLCRAFALSSTGLFELGKKSGSA